MMLDVLLYLLGVLIIFVGLALSIALHEIGHLVPAKLFGVKVTQYMVGFGRTIWSRRKGETEYGVKLLPLGGYVSMIGMYPPKKPGEAPRESTTGFLQQVAAPEIGPSAGTADAQGETRDRGSQRGSALSSLIDDAREASAETIAAGEDHRAFYQLAVWKKVIVMLGGPVMNLVLAVFFYALLVSGFGVPQTTTTLASVSECLVPANSQVTTCEEGSPPAPAAAAGLLPGDTILSIDGEEIIDWTQVQRVLARSAGVALIVDFERDGEVMTTTVTPAINERVVFDDRGEPLVGDDDEYLTEQVGMVGVTPASEMQRQPVAAAPGYVAENVRAVVGIILTMPERMVDVWNAAFGPEERDPNGPISVVGVGRLAGEVVSHDATPVLDKAQTMVSILASLNVALFVFNLVPLMPLDGGHVLGALYEGAKRRLWKLFGKRDPGPVDTAKMVPVTMVVGVLLIGMLALLVYADLVKPVTLFG